MKESLRLFNIDESGLGDIHLRISDDDIYQTALNIPDAAQKIKYLKENASKNAAGNVKSKRYLITLIKKDDLDLAFDLLFSVCSSSPSTPEDYMLFADVALTHNAVDIARSALEVAVWLCNEKEKTIYLKAATFLKDVLSRMKKREHDNSSSQEWKNKTVDKFWVLERTYYQTRTKQVVDLAFKLLDLYPENLENYDVVVKIFQLMEEKEHYKKLSEYLTNKSQLNDPDKKLYLGISSYEAADYKSSIQYLEDIVKNDIKNMKAKYYLALAYLLEGDIKSFIRIFNVMVPDAEAHSVALYFIYCAVSDFKLDSVEFPNQKFISLEIQKVIKKLLENNQHKIVDNLIKQFNNLNYQTILPFLNLYLAELLIKDKKLNTAKQLLGVCKDDEAHRLWAWIYRLEGKSDLAEDELIKYRKSWLPERGKGITCKPVPLKVPNNIPDVLDDIFKVVADLFKQAKDLISELELEYGLNSMTCIETGCQDCCNKTFPYVSYVEYLYLKSYIDNQNEDFKQQVYEKSKQIVDQFKKKYDREPRLVLGGRNEAQKEYPLGFQFSCPCLGDNKCNVYNNRPFTCRAYGYSSMDGIRYKGCSYFFEQFKGATKLTAIRKVLDMNSFINYASNVDTKLIGKHVIAPIPVWFASTYEENIAKIKQLN